MASRDDYRKGIESRVGADGVERHRAEVRQPSTRRKIRSEWTTSLAEARGARVTLLAQRAAGALTKSKLPTLGEAWDEFYAGALAGRPWARGGVPFSPKTLREYETKMRLYVLPLLRDVPVDRVRRSELQSLVDQVGALNTGQTARNTATPVQTLYRWLLPRHDDLWDPTVGLELPKGSEPRERIATPRELADLLAVVSGQEAVVFALAALAGLRHGEIRALDVGDVLLDARAIEVRESLDPIEGKKRPKSYAGERLVPIFDPLLPYVEEQLARAGDDRRAPLLTSKRAKWGRVNAVHAHERLVTKWEDAGLESLLLHEGRHTFASLLVVAGYDIASVSEWIGHSRPSTTLDRYVKPLRRLGVDPAAANEFLGSFPWKVPTLVPVAA